MAELVIFAKFVTAFGIVQKVGYAVVGCYALAIGRTYVKDYKDSVEQEKWAKE